MNPIFIFFIALFLACILGVILLFLYIILYTMILYQELGGYDLKNTKHLRNSGHYLFYGLLFLLLFYFLGDNKEFQISMLAMAAGISLFSCYITLSQNLAAELIESDNSFFATILFSLLLFVSIPCFPVKVFCLTRKGNNSLKSTFLYVFAIAYSLLGFSYFMSLMMRSVSV